MPDIFPDFIFLSFVVRLVYFLLALMAVVAFLRWLDWTLGIHGKFKTEVWNVLRENPLALAVYHGARFFAVVWLAGRFLS